MISFTRATVVALGAGTVLVALAGCSLLAPELPRDDRGQVLEPAIVGSTDLLVGDCFTFVENTDLSEATVAPCKTAHTHVVIGKGELATTEISKAGGLQNAVSASCSETFSKFSETVAEGVRPEQEFIISEHTTDDGALMTRYACLATDIAPPPA